uniref:Uncharacterized protein n=1 Tax=Mesocestoides corti TaxID=53468 RepID=A0A5K3F7W8_MESCO
MGPCIPKFTATSVNRRPITPSLNLAPYCLPQDHTVLQRFPTQARSASLSFFITVYQTKLAMVDATFTCKEVVVAMEWAYREWHAETYVCPLSTVTACLPDSVPNSEVRSCLFLKRSNKRRATLDRLRHLPMKRLH